MYFQTIILTIVGLSAEATGQDRNMTAYEGDDIIIPCSDNPTTTQYRHLLDWTVRFHYKHLPFGSARYYRRGDIVRVRHVNFKSDRYNITDPYGWLSIQKLQIEDEAEFKCVQHFSSFLRMVIDLRVHVKPGEPVILGMDNAKEGQVGPLVCMLTRVKPAYAVDLYWTIQGNIHKYAGRMGHVLNSDNVTFAVFNHVLLPKTSLYDGAIVLCHVVWNQVHYTTGTKIYQAQLNPTTNVETSTAYSHKSTPGIVNRIAESFGQAPVPVAAYVVPAVIITILLLVIGVLFFIIYRLLAKAVKGTDNNINVDNLRTSRGKESSKQNKYVSTGKVNVPVLPGNGQMYENLPCPAPNTGVYEDVGGGLYEKLDAASRDKPQDTNTGVYELYRK